MFCGEPYAPANCHFISRAKGGLGIEENILTACGIMTKNECHFQFDEGPIEVKEEMRERAREYLKKCYPGWDESKLVYNKWEG